MKHLALLASIVGSTFALDWTTKRWAECALVHGPRAVVGDTLRFVLAHNPGGAWSMLAAASPALRLVVFGGVGALAVVLLAVFGVRARSDLARAGAALVLGGALGNLVDRLLAGYVVDFVAVPHWPTFNVADVAISLGALALAASFSSASPSMRTVSHS